MSYALFWIELLLTALLWTATLIGCSARLARNWQRRVLIVLIVLPPLALLGALAAAAGAIKFVYRLDDNWFAYAVSLFAVFVMGMLVIILVGSRSSRTGDGRRASNWPRGQLALGLLVAAAVTSMTLWNMDLEVRSEAQVLRTDAGTLMLSVAPPYLPDSQNAAVLDEKAFALLKTDDDLRGENTPFEDTIPNEKHAKAAAVLARHEGALRLLRRAATIPDARFNHDYGNPSPSTLLPELNGAHLASRLLWLDARYQIARNNVESAATDINAMSHLARAIDTEPFFVSGLVAGHIDQSTGEALADLLAVVTRKDQVAQLQLGDPTFDLLRCLNGEKATGLSAFGELASNQFSLQMLVAMRSSSDGGTLPDWPALPMLYRVFLLRDDVADFDASIDAAQSFARARESFKERKSYLDSVGMNRRGIVTSQILPAISIMFKDAFECHAHHYAAQIGLAMTRHRLDHGSFPTSLDALVPEYLDYVPNDPFDGKPMRLAHKGDDWIVFSVGPDCHDDGGAEYDPAKKSGDLTFVLKAPK